MNTQETLTQEESQVAFNAAMQEMLQLKVVVEQRCVNLAAENKILQMKLEQALKPKE
jgi:hypothetical protein